MNCRTGKIGYSKRGVAFARKQMLAKGNKRNLNAYRCECGWWHLGSRPAWQVLVKVRERA